MIAILPKVRCQHSFLVSITFQNKSENHLPCSRTQHAEEKGNLFLKSMRRVTKSHLYDLLRAYPLGDSETADWGLESAGDWNRPVTGISSEIINMIKGHTH